MDLIKTFNVNNNFLWKDQCGNFINPKNMTTKHCFYTWLMIWNHVAPKQFRIWNNHKYIFPKFYTKEYMLEAFKQMYYELKNRNDLGFKSKQVLQKIEDLFSCLKLN